MTDSSNGTSLGRAIAIARLAVAAGCLIALFADPAEHSLENGARILLGCYGAYAAAIAVLIWRSGFSSRHWRIVRYVVDVATFAALNLLIAGASSPFFTSFVFLIICAALLFNMRAVIVSASAILAIYVGIAIAGEYVSLGGSFTLERFIARTVFLVVIAGLVTVMKAYQDHLQAQTRKLALWPATDEQDLRTFGSEMLDHCADLLRTPRVVIAWQDVTDGRLRLLIRQESETLMRDLPQPDQAIVIEQAPLRSFAFSPNGGWTAARLDTDDNPLQALDANPVESGFRHEYNIGAVFGASFSGRMVSGWILALDRKRVTSDDLTMAEVLAGLVVARLDQHYLSEQLRSSVLTAERIRLARDLHDGVLQSLSGAAVHVHLLALMMRRDPDAAATMAADVEQTLLSDQRELRSLIAQLRFASALTEEPRLATRGEALAQRVQREWGIKTDIEISTSADSVAPVMVDEIFWLLKEAITNAAMHSAATRVGGRITVCDERVRVTVEDNGRGFAFTGTYDLARLKEMKRGPVTLKERVISLDGEMIIDSSANGSRIDILIPLSRAEVAR